MDKNLEAGLRLGQELLRRIERFGADVREGPFLDVGCGWGRISYALLAREFAGTYIGIDVMKKRIDWLSRNVTSVRPNFTFHFTDVRNDRYNGNGKAERPRLADFVSEPVRTAAMLSVFTHMWEEDIEHYLRQVRSVMRPDATFLFTAFIMSKAAEEGIAAGRSKFQMAFSRGENCRYFRDDNPLHAVSYRAEFLDNMIRAAGFTPTYSYGTWSGTTGNHSQDWIVGRPV